jgi:hypothetical protein
MSNQEQISPLYKGTCTAGFGPCGQPTVGINVCGTISVGHYTPQVSDDGQNWYPISVLLYDLTVKTTITAAGAYRADVNGFQNFRLLPSNDFSGDQSTVQFFAFPKAMLVTTA